jgi:hypothetical protein
MYTNNKIRTTNELIENLDLWIPFLKRKENNLLLKKATITRMKLEGLEEVEINNGELTVEQEHIWDICVKECDEIEEKNHISILNDRLLH